MAPAERRRLVVNADDFGRSHSINAAVIRAHREGILTTASLMVGGAAWEEAVTLARAHPRLGVGLHLTLVCGTSTLPPPQIPGLGDASGRFPDNPVTVALRYQFSRSRRSQLESELAAQFGRFKSTGLPLDHVNGHLHLHLHPTVFGILMRQAESWGITRMRWTHDPLALNLRLARGRWVYRLGHALLFRPLSRRAKPELKRRGIRHTDRVFGLLQNDFVDSAYVCGLLASLPAGDSELYSHPSLDEFHHELQALTDPRAKDLLTAQGIELVRYRDL
jgi:hopanoid biosynthesis associated protein HpnK